MKPCINGLLLMAAFLFPVSLSAQTVVDVHSDVSPNEGGLNTAIQAAIDGGTLSSTVFQLDAGGYYILSGVVTTPLGSKLTIIGPDPGTTQATAPPQIVLSSGVTGWRYNFDCFGDISLKNVWLLYANVGGAQQGASLEIENDSTDNRNVGDFENVIFDYAPANGCVELRTKGFVGTFKNCYFRNDIDSHLRYYGRSVSWPYQSTDWHTDTVSFVNCTFANMGYAFMQESPEYSDHVWFNHCTFINTMMFSLESGYWYWLSVTNCIFENIYMYGDIISQRGGNNQTPAGGTVNIDTLSTTGLNLPFNEAQRHIVFGYSSYFMEKWLTDFLSNASGDNTYADTASATNKPLPQPMMSEKTRGFYNDKTTWPFIDALNLYDSTDPGFIFAPTNRDNIKTFLLGRWATGTNIDWSYDPTSDVNGIWPMNEDLSYTNSTLMTAGMGGFPLGDLYHWWPSQYATWAAQEATENQTINSWLNGTRPATAVKERPGVPAKFDLSQNYPNPFNPTTQIDYAVPQSGYVTLKVYNVLGEVVATLFAGIQRPGNYVATFDGSKIASGVYFYRLQAGNNSLTRKLVLMK